jgi:hypothetical protein
MGNNAVVGVEPWGSRSRAVFVDHTGPASYPTGGEILTQSNSFGGSNPFGLASFNELVGGLTVSGNYRVDCLYGGTGIRQTVKLKWSRATPSTLGSPSAEGSLLGLGTLSAAATQSTYTAAGLLTVVGANTLTPGQFIVFSNGASAAGIFLNGVMAQVQTATATGYTVNFGQGTALAYTIATDTLKYQVVQVSSGNQLQAQSLPSPITGVLATANLLTITQANSLSAGQFVYLNGPFKTASVYALGAIVQVQTATATGWTANWQGTIIAQTSGEVAVASLLVTNGGAPVSAYPYQTGPTATITNSLAVASDATHAGLLTLTAAQAYQPGMLIVVQNVGANTQLNGTIGTVITTGLTQAIIKANAWTVIASTSAETAGYASVLVTGAPTTSEVTAGANLSGETVRLLVIGG